MNENCLRPVRNSGCRVAVWLLSFLIFFGLAEGQVLVNCLVAMVDEMPVSLYDLKIIDLFGLEPELTLIDRPLKKEDLVNIYINELLVVNLAREHGMSINTIQFHSLYGSDQALAMKRPLGVSYKIAC